MDTKFRRTIVAAPLLALGFLVFFALPAAVSAWQEASEYAQYIHNKPRAVFRKDWEEHRSASMTRAIVWGAATPVLCFVFVYVHRRFWKLGAEHFLGLSRGAWLFILWLPILVVGILFALKAMGRLDPPRNEP